MLVESNGVTFHLEMEGWGPTLLMLHGFTGSAASWNGVVPLLAPHFRLLRPDLIGHGRTDGPADPDRYTMDHAAEDMINILDRLDIYTFGVLGYSMGARLALHLALKAPRRIDRIVLESGTYGISSQPDRAKRAADDRALAQWIETNGIEAFARRWESHPLFASQQSLPLDVINRQREERLCQRPEGLANSLRGMGTGAQQSLQDRLVEVTMPTLLICGALDEKFTRLARQMHGLIPRSELAVIPQAGHNVHLERPDIFSDHILRFWQGESAGNVEQKDDKKETHYNEMRSTDEYDT